MTVNHDVTGSSPVGGAKRKQSSNSYSVFVYPIESNWSGRRVFLICKVLLPINHIFNLILCFPIIELLLASGFDELL